MNTLTIEYPSMEEGHTHEPAQSTAPTGACRHT